jgi:prophage antirepressor-like protein
MDIMKAFSLLDIEYPVNIQGTIDDPLFQANQIGKLLGIVKIHNSLNDFTNDEKVSCSTSTLGGNQEMIFLTELGLYRLLGRSRKPIAHKFQEWMVRVLKEIRINGIYKLQQDKEIDKQLFIYKCEVSSHKTFLKAYDKKNVVYICKFQKVGENYIIKIGSTQDIKERITNLSNTFDCHEPLLIDVFEDNNYKKFEKKIHHSEYISQFYEKTNKKDGTVSRETYLVNDDIYKEFINVIKKIKCMFVTHDVKEIEELKIIQLDKEIKMTELKNKELETGLKNIELNIELKKIELEMKKIELELELNKSAQKQFIVSDNDVESDEEEDMEDEEPTATEPNYIKKRNNGLTVPKVYQYNPDDLKTPIRVFDSPSEVERTLSFVSTPALKRAFINNTIYKDYRWIYVNRMESPPETLEETVITKYKTSEVRFVSMIDIKKTKILAVYASQKEAVEARNMKCNSFTRAIQQQHVSSGHYWNFFDNCSTEMKDEYLKTNTLPEKLANASGIKIQRIDPITKNVLSTYNSKRDIVKKYQISYIKLNSLVNNNSDEVYHGFIWKLQE